MRRARKYAESLSRIATDGGCATMRCRDCYFGGRDVPGATCRKYGSTMEVELLADAVLEELAEWELETMLRGDQARRGRMEGKRKSPKHRSRR